MRRPARFSIAEWRRMVATVKDLGVVVEISPDDTVRIFPPQDLPLMTGRAVLPDMWKPNCGRAMGKIKMRYYTLRRRSGRVLGYWQPTKTMREAGFALVNCGDDGPAAWRVAEEWNARWDSYRVCGIARRWPIGSLVLRLMTSVKQAFGQRRNHERAKIGHAAGDISSMPSARSRRKQSSWRKSNSWYRSIVAGKGVR